MRAGVLLLLSAALAHGEKHAPAPSGLRGQVSVGPVTLEIAPQLPEVGTPAEIWVASRRSGRAEISATHGESGETVFSLTTPADRTARWLRAQFWDGAPHRLEAKWKGREGGRLWLAGMDLEVRGIAPPAPSVLKAMAAFLGVFLLGGFAGAWLRGLPE